MNRLRSVSKTSQKKKKCTRFSVAQKRKDQTVPTACSSAVCDAYGGPTSSRYLSLVSFLLRIPLMGSRLTATRVVAVIIARPGNSRALIVSAIVLPLQAERKRQPAQRSC